MKICATKNLRCPYVLFSLLLFYSSKLLLSLRIILVWLMAIITTTNKYIGYTLRFRCFPLSRIMHFLLLGAFSERC